MANVLVEIIEKSEDAFIQKDFDKESILNFVNRIRENIEYIEDDQYFDLCILKEKSIELAVDAILISKKFDDKLIESNALH